MSVLEISDADFKTKVLESNNPVIVDFHAVWCGPCQMLAPILDDVSDEIKTVDFYSIDVDESPELAAKLNIEGIPTLLRFEQGKEKDRVTGLLPKPKLIKFIEGK